MRSILLVFLCLSSWQSQSLGKEGRTEPRTAGQASSGTQTPGTAGRASSTQVLEPWADAALPVKEKLTLWLDASRITEAQKAFRRGELKKDGGLATWCDGSGNRLDLRQDALNAMPRVLSVGKDALVRFDGEDDHFRLTQVGKSLEQFTVFLVASPRRNQGLFRGALALNASGERDYTSGLNLDLGPAASRRFEFLNIEGKGFGGRRIC